MDEVMAAPDAPAPSVMLVSAGASHSVALLCKAGSRHRGGNIFVEHRSAADDGLVLCALLAADNMLCSWGRGEDGQLGHGDVEDRLVPTVLSGFHAPGISLVICGADHTTAYSEDELQVYSWGWGDFGRLGHGNSTDVFMPQPVKALQGLKIKQISCGDSHCLAVTMDGEVHR
jgi:alpha-tubulin suppressor-like RCC1 family protein